MKIAASLLAGVEAGSTSKPASRLSDFVALMKPRVMTLSVFTALVGLAKAPLQLDPVQTLFAVTAMAAGAGAAGILNMWYDADIDALMTRTAMRPIPSGRVSRAEALTLGLVLAAGAVLLMALATNLVASALLGGTILFYTVIYTAWLKRRTPQNIVIGGLAGALPPVIGWAAATGDIGYEPLALLIIIFLWTPPHFWSLALNRTDDYAKAGVPMLPIISGNAATKRQILIYSVLLALTSALPWALGIAAALYGVIAAICSGIFVLLAFKLLRSGGTDRRAACRLFRFSIVYLFVLFAALLLDRGNHPAALARSSGIAGVNVRLAHIDPRSAIVGPARRCFVGGSREA